MFEHIDAYAGDPILGLVEQFQQDKREHKVNLGIGIYFDDTGKLPLPKSVEIASAMIDNQAKSYLPMEGHTGFRQTVSALLFGENHVLRQENRLAVVQTLGGSGALKLGADFLKRWFPQSRVWVSNPTWDNHRGIFEGAGFEVGTYPYYDAETISIQLNEMKNFLRGLPENDIVLLHPCCHNPTGVDLSIKQWDDILHIIQEKKLIPFMDMAYQGFGENFEQDAYAIVKAGEMGLPVFVSASFSKNMSLYGQRVGALAVATPTPAEAERVLGQLKLGVRRIYSSPPVQGGLTAYYVLSNQDLKEKWQNEVYEMRDRIRAMRQKLYAVLQAKLPEKNFDYLIEQRGMFSYTGLNPQQVRRLRDEFAIYLVESGRMCVAGLNQSNIDYVADALVAVFQNH